MDMIRRSTLPIPLTLDLVKPNWLKFIPQTSPDTHYSPRYLILQFPLERVMVNVFLYRCCATQINSSRKSGRGGVMQPFIKRSILVRRGDNWAWLRVSPEQNSCRQGWPSAQSHICVAGNHSKRIALCSQVPQTRRPPHDHPAHIGPPQHFLVYFVIWWNVPQNLFESSQLPSWIAILSMFLSAI